jgi:hypothetical protein
VVIGRLIPAGTGLFDQPEEEGQIDYLLPSTGSELIGAPAEGTEVPVAGEDADAEDLSPGEVVYVEEEGVEAEVEGVEAE